MAGMVRRSSSPLSLATFALAAMAAAMFAVSGCEKADSAAGGGATTRPGGGKQIVVGYSQIGAESDWRTANTASIKETAETLGIKQLVFSDAQQKQENQISAVRSCIQQGVSVIALRDARIDVNRRRRHIEPRDARALNL